MCKVFSQSHGLNHSKQEPDEVAKELTEGMIHVAFACGMCEAQAEGKRFHMFKRPAGASPWHYASIEVIRAMANAEVAKFHFCMVGVKGYDWPATRRTAVMINAKRFAARLAKAQCDEIHEHLYLIKGRAHHCQIYLEMFSNEVRNAIAWES